MRKRGFTAIVVLLLLVVSLTMPTIIAHADVLVEPNNDFYYRNRNRMEYMGRNFYANGENGYITLVIEPNAAREVASFKNSEMIHIMFTYDDNGVVWGVTQLYVEGVNFEDRPTGWVQMNQLYVVYDSGAFMDAHSAAISEREFNLAKLDFDGDMVMWTWPGSGVFNGKFNTQGLFGDDETNMNHGITVYTDADGREWGYLGYFYGWRNVWVCLDDPSNPNIPAFNPAPELNLIPAADPPAINLSGGTRSSLSMPMIAITLVALVAIVSLVLIRVLWDKKKNEE